jgi:TRAP-type C4-dicarboxylate transport system substrate-binding protein
MKFKPLAHVVPVLPRASPSPPRWARAPPTRRTSKNRIIRFGYGLNEMSNQGRATKLFAEEVEKNSGGKMKLRAIGAAALGSDVQMQQALIGGAQEMMVGSTATLVGITKEMAIWDTPFLFNNGKEADAVLDGPVGQKIMDKLQEKGLVGLVYWENGFAT